MASLTTHFIVAASLALPYLRCGELREVLEGWKIPLSAGLLATVCDLDHAGRRVFGISNNSVVAHRGFFHSPFFLVVLAAGLVGIVARGQSRKAVVWLWLLWAGSMVTHPLLDALTDGGRGVMLMLPLSSARFFFPWRPIHTLPGSVENILNRALLIRGSEIPFCVTSSVVGVFGLLARRRRSIEPLETPSSLADHFDARSPIADDTPLGTP